MLRSSDLAGRVEAVARAADGRMFLSKGDAFDAEALFAAPFNDLTRLERLWAVGLERRLRLCREVGATLVVLVAPEAHGVHADVLPPPLAYATPTVADRFAALARGMGVGVVFPRDALTAARGAVEVYRRDDSHWSAFGAFLAYRAVMDALPPALARGAVGPEAVAFAWSEGVGDLGWASETVAPRPRLQATFDAPRARTVRQQSNERRHGLKITEIEGSDLPSVLVFRDSFGSELAPFLVESFRRTVLLGCEERAYLEAIAEERPDVVIVERSERSLLNGVVDWSLETWREAFPEAGADALAAEAELTARARLAEDEAEAAAFAAERALADEPTVSRAILAGRAHLAAGRVQAAIAALEQAEAQTPGRWAALIHLGVAQLAAGQGRAARDLFARACAVAPWNPAGFEHYGFTALHQGDAESAAAALRTAVRLGPEVSGAHLWLVEALQRLGRGEEVEVALAEGLRACPDDPLLAAQAEGLRSPLPQGES